MSLALSRFVDASTVLKSPSQCSRSLTFNTTSHWSSLKSKNLSSHGFHGSFPISLQYNPTPKNFFACSNVTPPGAPLPSGSPSSSLRSWVVGILLTILLPLITRKGSLIQLKNKVDTVVETMDHVMESVEKVAKEADETLDEITSDLPENSIFRENLEAFDEMVEDVAKHAHVANGIIDKVEETGKKLESLIVDEVKEKAVSIRVLQEEVSTQEQTV